MSVCVSDFKRKGSLNLWCSDNIKPCPDPQKWVGKLFPSAPNLWFNTAGQVGTAWRGHPEQGSPVERAVCRGWQSCHSKPWHPKVLVFIFETLISLLHVDAFFLPGGLFWLCPVSSSLQAVQITSQTAGLAADERHYHWGIVLQRSHWQRTDRQCHPTHFKNGACRLQLSNHWPQPLKAEVTLLWTEFTVPLRDIRNQMELLLPGRLWIVTLRITKIESIFPFGFLKKNLSDQAGVRNYTTLSVL